MIFSDRLLFLHVPKAGGSSIVRTLLEVLPRPVHYSLPVDHAADVPEGVERFEGIAHEGLAEARAVLERRGRDLDGFDTIIACIRDPFELEVSRFSFLRQDLNKYNHGPQQAVALLGDFELFAACSRPHGSRPPEVYYMLDGATPANLRIVRLENVDEELPRCLAGAGIEVGAARVPHYNRSEHDDVSRYYTAAAEQAVYDKYRWVIDNGFYPRLDPGDGGAPSIDVAARVDVDAIVAPERLAAADAFGRANAWLAAAEIHRHTGRLDAQRDALERALAEAHATGSDRLVMRIGVELGRCLGLGGPASVADGIRACEQLLGVLPPGRGSGSIRLALAELLAASGRFDEARALCAEVAAASVEQSLAAASAAGSVALLAGDPGAAEASFRRGRPWNTSDFAGDHAEALLRLGRDEEADAVAAATASTAVASDAVLQSRWRRVRAAAAATRGDVPRALGLVAEAVDIAACAGSPNAHADALVGSAEVLDQAGREDDARAALGEAVRLYEEKGNVVSAGRAAGLLAGRPSAA